MSGSTTPVRQVQILEITNAGDGDGRKWPKHTLIRNDAYFHEKVAELWIKDLPNGPQPDITYRLDRLPNGYAGFEKARPDSKHVDRYIYGHSNGQFRSLTEYYPHFKFLMDYGNAFGCDCKLCAGGGSRGKAKASKPTGVGESRPIRNIPQIVGSPPMVKKSDRSDSEVPRPMKRRLVDMENTPDVYDILIEKLEVDRDIDIDEPIEERMSPDWRTSNSMSKSLWKSWQSLPRFAPRVGEIVVFVRALGESEVIAWNQDNDAFQRFNVVTHEWLDHPDWEAGVITQLPEEPIMECDLLDDTNKEKFVNESGFRIEPLSEIGSDRKPLTKQYKYVPLHLIRPFSLWSECMTGVERSNWHPSITHALTVANSFCLIGRYRFKGRWPNATVFCRGLYVGPELIMVGDTVTLSPHPADPQDTVTDVMLVTAIRLRFVNLDLDETGLISPPADAPYQTGLHISGKLFTLDPTRSFDGVGKMSIDPSSDDLPSGLGDYGQWYYVHDPKESNARLEIPFTRVLSRLHEASASKIWFRDVINPSLEHTKRAGASAPADDGIASNISRGSEGVRQARRYSSVKDPRIRKDDGKSWFWADTRIEQLDLHEVNNRSVGIMDTERTKGQITKLRTALKAIDGKASAIAQHQAAKRQKDEEEDAKTRSVYGMVAASAHANTQVEIPDAGTGKEAEREGIEIVDLVDEEEEEEEDDSDDHLDEMELDEPESAEKHPISTMASANTSGAIAVSSDSDDSDDAETNMRAAKLAMSMRTNNARP